MTDTDADSNPTGPEDRTAPITVYLSDVLDLEHLDASALDSLDLALKSDGPFMVETIEDGRVCLYLPFGDDHMSFAMALSADVARRLAEELRKQLD